MFEPDEDGVYAHVSASPPRRLFACGVLFGLGALLLYLPLEVPLTFWGTVTMLAFGFGVLVLAEQQRRATLLTLSLTETELWDSSGRLLAKMDEIVLVDRGTFAFKPSNGFTLVLNTKKPRAWVPGLWWRVGRRVGVGGVTSSGQAKFMAEQIALRLSDR